MKPHVCCARSWLRLNRCRFLHLVIAGILTGMFRMASAGIALLMAAAVPAVVVPAESISVASTRGSAAAAAPVRVSTWQGGHAVAVPSRWWPRGRSHASAPWPAGWPRPVAFDPTHTGPLSGLVIALDPGHDTGNFTHSRQINAHYRAGPIIKACNTTGTATNAGYREATYTFDVAARLRRLLIALGATVVVTRDRNTSASYGPCVEARGPFPGQEGAAFMLSIHADGGPARGRGFHVIAPAYVRGWTDDMAVPSRTLARSVVRAMRGGGFGSATYLSTAIRVRADQATLLTSDVPTVIVETLNMRNARDAAIASSRAGRQRIARALANAAVAYAASLR